jgi:hypothetical protein
MREPHDLGAAPGDRGISSTSGGCGFQISHIPAAVRAHVRSPRSSLARDRLNPAERRFIRTPRDLANYVHLILDKIYRECSSPRASF